MAMKVLVPAFFSRQDTKTPMIIALLSLILNIILNYFLAFYMGYGHFGLAIASSIAALLSVTLLSILLARQGLISFKILFSSFAGKILIASSALIGFLLLIAGELDFEILDQMQRVTRLSLVVFVSIIIYFGVSHFLGIKLKDFR
jgi:putative peptidoglycan lipid II flippase